MTLDDVILAVASPPGRSLRGIVRASGASAFDVLAHIARPAPGSCTQDLGSRGVRAVRLRIEPIDLPALLLAFPGPRSYTGEHAFELLLPGHPGLLNRVIDRLIDVGRLHGMAVRRAEPGEFTARAYFNGRLSLTEAEGVSATIAARSDAELRAAHLLTSGRLGSLAGHLADDVAAALALVEAGIDFTDEEDVVAIAPDELLARVRTSAAQIEEQLERAVGFEELEAIPWVVIAGAPNAGKSTLFNALLGRTRAVVAEAAGTTRDMLTEPLHLTVDGHDAEVMLVDIAGLDEDDQSILSRQMQRAARSAIERAELIVQCVPADVSTAECAAEVPVAEARAASRITIRTKADLVPADEAVRDGELAVSAHTGRGLDRLRRAIADRLSDRAVSLAADALALQPRHEAALRSARVNLADAIELIEPIARQRHLDRSELVAGCLRAALDDLAALAGDITPDDVLGRIFASFCVGK